MTLVVMAAPLDLTGTHRQQRLGAVEGLNPEPLVKVQPGQFRGERDDFCDGSILYLINIKSFVGCDACGYVGEDEHFPAFRARSGSGESGAGRQSRSPTYPQAVLVNLPRRAIAEAPMLALLVVEVEPSAKAGLGVGHRRIGVAVDLIYLRLRTAVRRRCCPCTGPCRPY